MAEPGTAPVGQPDPSVTVPAGGEASKDVVSFETHRKLLEEKKKALALTLSLQGKLEEFEAKEKAREEELAKKRGDFDAILKSREDELKKKDEQLRTIASRIEYAEKKSAVIEAIGASIDPKWHKFIDISEVAVNPDTGEVDALTVSKVAEAFKREFPEAIKRPGQLPASAPQGLEGAGGKISRSDWIKLSSKEMLKWKPDQIID